MTEIEQLRAQVERMQRELEELKVFAEGHHADQPAHVFLHALTVDIPHRIDAALSEKFAMAAYDELPALLEELRQLRETVGKLPKTADGVPVVPGVDRVWGFHEFGDGPSEGPIEVDEYGDVEGSFHECGTYNMVPISRCYSTKAAAEAAKEQVQ